MLNGMDLPVEINDLVQVRLLSGEPKAAYPSRVDDVIADGLILNWPTEKGTRLTLRPGQPVALYFVRQDAVYYFVGDVLKTLPEPVPRILVRPSGPVQRIQRRGYFRVCASLPVQLSGVVGPPEAGSDDPGKPMHILAHTVDISGAGMSIRQSFPIPADSIFETRLTLEKGEAPLQFRSRVVHCEPVAGAGDRLMYHIAFGFESITEAQRRTIVRHVFNIQRSSPAP